ncbi:hypothetical protein ACFLS1_01840 [Verrucomicrobiota bacterium]
MKRAVALIILCSMLFAGCSTTGKGCWIIVGNAGDDPVTDVVVESDGIMYYRAEAIGAHSTANYKGMENDMTSVSTVRWKTKEGIPVVKEVRIDKPLRQDFNGRLFFQIDKAGNVKLFVMPDSDGDSTTLPWAQREIWEGTPGLPGLNQ